MGLLARSPDKKGDRTPKGSNAHEFLLLECDHIESEDARRAIRRFCKVLRFGSVPEMRHSCEQNAVWVGDCCTYIHLTDEETALAWCARHFARLDSVSSLASYRISCNREVGEAEAALLTAIESGDSEKIARCAARVIEGERAEGNWSPVSLRDPRLSALVWAAHNLSERIGRGELDSGVTNVTLAC